MKNNFRYTKNNDREIILNYLEKNNFKRVLDIGYAANTWSSKYVTHFIDIYNPDNKKICFEGDINFPTVWELVESDVAINGIFDFCICTHTFEDIISPLYVSNMIEKYCKSGYVAVPSKYIELKNYVENYWKGYIHHRYIFNKEGDEFIGYPKMGFIEKDSRFDKLSSDKTSNNEELQFFWKDTIDMKIINNNFLGPDINSVLNYYNNLLNE